MNEIDAPGQADRVQRRLQFVDGLFDPLSRKPRRTEKSQHARPRHLDHHAGGRNPVRHIARDIRKANAMRLRKRAVAQPFGIKRRQHRQHLVRGLARRARRPMAFAEADPTGFILQDADGLAKPRNRRRNLRRVKPGALCPLRVPIPMPLFRGNRGHHISPRVAQAISDTPAATPSQIGRAHV